MKLIVLLLSGVITAASVATDDPRDEAVLNAIIRDTLRSVAVGRTAKGEPERTITIADKTLAVCPAVITRPCLHETVIAMAKSAAARGRWPPALTELLVDQNRNPRDVGKYNLDRVVDGSALPRPLPLAFTAPVYLENRALVYVQFARGWSALVLVAKQGDGWKVVALEAVGES